MLSAEPTCAPKDLDSHLSFRAIAALLLIAVVMTLAWVRIGGLLDQREPDFAVYFGATFFGDDLYSRNVQHPSMPTGGLPFTYPPFAALLFAPMQLLAFDTARVAWQIASASAVVVIVILVFRRRRPAVVATVATVLSTPFAANVMMGQISVFVALLVVLDFASRERRPTWLPLGVGVGVGLAAAIKVTPVLVIIYFIAVRRWRDAAVAAATAGAATLIAAVVYPRSTRRFVDLLPELHDRVDVLGYFATYQNTGVTGLLAQGHVIDSSVLAITIGACLLGLGIAAYVRRVDRFAPPLLLLGAAALASPVAWLHHWVTLVPLILIALRHTQLRWLRRVLVGVLIVQLTGSVYLAEALPPGTLRVLPAAAPALAYVVSAGALLMSERARRTRQTMPLS